MLFTGHGDLGYTDVIGGPSLLKCDARLEAVGALDEAQAHLGLVRAMLAETAWAEPIRLVQADLALLMAECATTPTGDSTRYISEAHVTRLECELLSWEADAPSPGGFVTPGDSVLDAQLHLARTAIRRAERRAVALHQSGGIENPVLLTYLNRLSSWVFGLAIVVGASRIPKELS
jgi:cob(I)alamin adenosyltransferase